MTRRATPLARIEAMAEITARTGQQIIIEQPDGTTIRIAPPDAPSPLGVTDQEQAICDGAFGLSP